ncbi:MAG: YdcF family protein [Lentisphaeria bacterium]|nr:YdcF family protein [Lentisphaeria bacterium]
MPENIDFLSRIRRLAARPAVRISLLAAAVLVLLTVLGIYHACSEVKDCTQYVYGDPADLPEREYGLVLGAARIVQGRYLNEFYRLRIETAVRLYRAGKIRKIIVSGDNSRAGYNEPADMKADLMQAGVPGTDILLDYAGFRTLDSVMRAKALFGAEQFTVISQRFHCERAIYLARAKNLDAIGFAAPDPPVRYQFKSTIREPLACFKAWLDIHLLRTRPKFEK